MPANQFDKGFLNRQCPHCDRKRDRMQMQKKCSINRRLEMKCYAVIKMLGWEKGRRGGEGDSAGYVVSMSDQKSEKRERDEMRV